MLTVEAVAKAYGDVDALRGVSLEVGPGEILALLGPNGAGKSTLISVIATLLKPDAGTVRVDGRDAAAEPDHVRSSIGLVPQDTALYWSLTARENLQFFAEIAGLRGTAADHRVAEVAEAFELDATLGTVAAKLSGGQARRLHAALALMHSPPLLLMDEPTVGADIAARQRLLAAVQALADDGTAVLYTTHYLHEVEELGADIVIIDHGEVIARGSQGDLLAAHGQAQVELSFRGDAPVLPGGDVAGSIVRVPAEQPARAIPDLIAGLGDDVGRLDGVEIVRPNLDAVFLALTGRRFDADDSDIDQGEPTDVG